MYYCTCIGVIVSKACNTTKDDNHHSNVHSVFVMAALCAKKFFEKQTCWPFVMARRNYQDMVHLLLKM